MHHSYLTFRLVVTLFHLFQIWSRCTVAELDADVSLLDRAQLKRRSAN